MQDASKTLTVNSQAVLRITALWACSEAFLGGMLHALKIPMAGIFLATFASICISVIAVSTKSKGAILRATLVVLAVKFALSPHSPIMAYLAVGMQGLFGELVFFRRKNYKIPAFVLSLFSLVYSAVQHLLVLLILFGKDFYDALNIFLKKITETFLPNANNIVDYIVLFYLFAYFVAGIVAGFINIKIVVKIRNQQIPDYVLRAQSLMESPIEIQKKKNKWKRYKKYLILIGIFSVLFLSVSYFPNLESQLSKNKLLFIMLRSVLIILVWMFAVSPIIQFFFTEIFTKESSF